MSQQPPTEPGWYDDPGGGRFQVYWNGTIWTGARPDPLRGQRRARVAGWVFYTLAGGTWLTYMVMGDRNPGSQTIWIDQLAILVIGGGLAVIALLVWAGMLIGLTRAEKRSTRTQAD